jgi:hypothetical protein
LRERYHADIETLDNIQQVFDKLLTFSKVSIELTNARSKVADSTSEINTHYYTTLISVLEKRIIALEESVRCG